jgi:hypothetical protein
MSPNEQVHADEQAREERRRRQIELAEQEAERLRAVMGDEWADGMFG